jgi:hypothetical protein
MFFISFLVSSLSLFPLKTWWQSNVQEYQTHTHFMCSSLVHLL